MGKKILSLSFAGLLTLLISGYAFAAELQAESKISQVTVYPDSALLTRTAPLKLNTGDYSIIFSDIIPEVDENSLRISSSGTAEAKIQGVQVKKEFLQDVPVEKVKQLQDELQKLQDDMKRLQDEEEALSAEKQFLDSVRLFSQEQIPKDLVTKIPQAKDLDDTYKFLDIKLKDYYSRTMDIEVKRRDLQKKIDALRKELAQLTGPSRKLKRSIAVDLQVLKAGSLDLSVSYLVQGASWYALYDARADFEKSAVEMASYGIIAQRTGEDWQDVDILLSTARPAIGGRMPYVAPWFLRPYQPVPRAMESKRVAKSANLPLQYEAFKDEDEGGIGGPPEEKLAEVKESGIAVIYKLLKKATVKSDGSEHKLPISSQTLNAKFEYSSFPRAVLNAYLGSRVTNAPNLQLLGGRVNVFLDGDFVGTSSIDNIGPGEEFDLYLGADENVKVKKEQIEKKVDETLLAGIPSPTRRTTFKYKLTVENYKSKKINVKLFEAMPVPEDDRIKVKISQANLEPKEKDWKDRKGVWLWGLELEPKAKREIIYTYIVEHPRDMQVEGL